MYPIAKKHICLQLRMLTAWQRPLSSPSHPPENPTHLSRPYWHLFSPTSTSAYSRVDALSLLAKSLILWAWWECWASGGRSRVQLTIWDSLGLRRGRGMVPRDRVLILRWVNTVLEDDDQINEAGERDGTYGQVSAPLQFPWCQLWLELYSLSDRRMRGRLSSLREGCCVLWTKWAQYK